MKRLYNTYSLYESRLIEELKHFYEQPEAIILFGSYEKGTDNEKSDIDIAVITNKQKLPELTRFEKKLKRKIDILTIDLKSASKEFKNSLANGIVLEGYLELIK
ncbi:nucleotidyltransferase domain-containing protein [Candidatus Woesearchaeota archaeon]|nr:nucleotidyltransferase domain-containing protein [Candidatus Woesearchaeota archaeon]